MMLPNEDESFETRAIHGGNAPEQWSHQDIVPPIVTTTTFKQVSPGVTKDGYSYGRFSCPTRTVLEKCLAELEQAKYSLVFNAGVGGMVALAHTLHSGDHILCIDDLYAGTGLYFTRLLVNFNIETTFTDCTSLEKVEQSIQPNTKFIWLENPTNPLLKVIDIQRISDLAHRINPDILVVVDNTFLTPYFLRPLSYGADIVLYSLTKYMNGHSDVVMGSLSTNNQNIYEQLVFIQKNLGLAPSPFGCYLVNRSLKTLKLRMEKHASNGLKVAEFLESHPKVVKVLCPALRSHPQHELFTTTCHGHSGLLSFYIRGGGEVAKKFCTLLKVATLCDSLGGASTTVVIPAICTKGYVDEKLLDRQDTVTENLVRISVGLEDVNDLIRDLDQALNLADK